MKIKICGITNINDAQLADQNGADYIGLIFAKQSPRCIDLAKAQNIVAALQTAKPVGVFVEQTWSEIVSTAALLKLYAVQVYTPPQGEIACKTVYVIRCKDQHSLERMETVKADYYLLDTYHPHYHGGTGQAFDWQLLPAARQQIWLAGGINSANIVAACQLQPDTIDVCSGVEASPGQKDPTKLKQLLQEFHHARKILR